MADQNPVTAKKVIARPVAVPVRRIIATSPVAATPKKAAAPAAPVAVAKAPVVAAKAPVAAAKAPAVAAKAPAVAEKAPVVAARAPAVAAKAPVVAAKAPAVAAAKAPAIVTDMPVARAPMPAKAPATRAALIMADKPVKYIQPVPRKPVVKKPETIFVSIGKEYQIVTGRWENGSAIDVVENPDDLPVPAADEAIWKFTVEDKEKDGVVIATIYSVLPTNVFNGYRPIYTKAHTYPFKLYDDITISSNVYRMIGGWDSYLFDGLKYIEELQKRAQDVRWIAQATYTGVDIRDAIAKLMSNDTLNYTVPMLINTGYEYNWEEIPVSWFIDNTKQYYQQQYHKLAEFTMDGRVSAFLLVVTDANVPAIGPISMTCRKNKLAAGRIQRLGWRLNDGFLAECKDVRIIVFEEKEVPNRYGQNIVVKKINDKLLNYLRRYITISNEAIDDIKVAQVDSEGSATEHIYFEIDV